MHPKVSHFILTRFNLATPGREEEHRSRQGWLDRRISLFEKYCLPSIEAQTKKCFIWMIYADVRTPVNYMDRLEGYQERDYIQLRWVDGLDFNLSTVRDDIRAYARDQAFWVITTRLDNDDAIHERFIEILQHQCHFLEHEVLNFSRGLILDRGHLYEVIDRSNAFTSLVEPLSELRTVWCRQHTDLELIAPVRQIDTYPMWLQIIHEDNVLNRRRGFRLADGAHLAAQFGIRSNELKPSRRWEVLGENVVMTPLRWARDFLKAAMRSGMHRFEKHTGMSVTETLRRFHEGPN